jgi:hypothetical protein
LALTVAQDTLRDDNDNDANGRPKIGLLTYLKYCFPNKPVDGGDDAAKSSKGAKT